MGRAAPLETEWVKGSIAAVTSVEESFGMTIVEAMRCGLPVVSTDCAARTPRDHHAGAGRAARPVGDADGVADALLSLIDDGDRRRRDGGGGAGQRRPGSTRNRWPGGTRSCSTGCAGPNGADRGPVVAAGAAAAAGGHPRPMEGAAAATCSTPCCREGCPGGRRAVGRADCRIDGRNLCFTLPTGPRRLRGATLVCEPRSGAAAVGIGFTRDAGTWQASLAVDAPVLAEGRWDLFLRERQGRRYRLRPRLLDLRALVDGGTEALPLVRNLPYRTAKGRLAVVCRRRERHAEFERIEYGRRAPSPSPGG